MYLLKNTSKILKLKISKAIFAIYRKKFDCNFFFNYSLTASIRFDYAKSNMNVTLILIQRLLSRERTFFIHCYWCFRKVGHLIFVLYQCAHSKVDILKWLRQKQTESHLCSGNVVSLDLVTCQMHHLFRVSVPLKVRNRAKLRFVC